MRRLLAAATLVLAAAPATGAHVPARLAIVEPAEGATVDAGRVRVVVAGEGGLAAASFQLFLDDQPVDATGRIGGVFSTLLVAPNERLTLEVPVGAGEHTLVARPNADPDSQQVTAVRRFRAAPAGGGSVPAMALAGVAVVVALGTAVTVRRRAAAAAHDDAP